jgi:diacylglycerol kinase (ATP)
MSSPLPRRAASRLASFRHAFAGWWHVLRTQRNAWIHAIISTGVLVLGLWLGLNRIEWASLLLTMALVWMAEFVNTALEAVVDLASPDLHPLAKIGKDVGAAAVLVSALTAVIVGLLILGPPLWAKVIILFGGPGL